jgi:Cytochrome b(C-terminal)/b6/petD
MADVTQEKKRTVPVDDKVHTWPHLTRNEFLCALFVLIVLTLWALLIDAPLESPANPTRTPNPSKAPWYFLGLQEMLVYFDPWNAGVVMPSLIIVGLMVIPFIDINPKGNGYYCFKDRKWELLTFFFGFHVLWISMIIIGTFFRGPGWNLFWPWQRWDPHKVVALTNVDLPYLLGFRNYIWSAVFGLVVIFGYFVVAIAAFYFWILRVKGREFLDRWGMARFSITAFLVVTMLALPFKMFLRLAFNVKYILVTPWINV